MGYLSGVEKPKEIRNKNNQSYLSFEKKNAGVEL